MEGASSINRSVRRRRRGEEERKREREERRERERRRERRKERKKKRKRKRGGRRPTVSSSIHWHFDSRNSLNQGVKYEDSTRGYVSKGRDSSYFGCLWTIVFGLILEPCCAMLMV